MANETVRTAPGALSVQAVRDLVRDWYVALDRHVELAEAEQYLDPDGLRMVFPEATLRSVAEFEGWYDTVTHRFFDEEHTLNRVEVTLRGDGVADVDVVVNWQARIWDAPAAASQWLGFDSGQTWEVVADGSGRPLIRTYIVDSLVPMPGSAPL